MTGDGRMLLAGRTAVVTGNPYGIGRATAALFAREGAHLLCIDDSSEGWADASVAPGAWPHVREDVVATEGVARAVQACAERFDQVDILVNLAGRAEAHRFEATTAEVWARMLDRN